MAETIKCPGCRAVLRVRDDLIGKRIKCPRCAEGVDVPSSPGGITKQAPPRAAAPVLVEPLDEEEDPQDDEAPARKSSQYPPCPRCGAEEARRVKFTWWGSIYFTRLFKHVRCQECGYGYNGRTGKSNLLPAIVCVSIALAALLGVLGFIVWFIHRQGYF
jgi:DNA-directed RNA polymerase subunit M/transcription elongation factor TFIIS